MIKIALAHNHFDIDKLAAVIVEMQKMGAPTIRVYETGIEAGFYQAIEGCHRLRAAAALGLNPDFEILDEDTLIKNVDNLDCELDDDEPIASIGDWENTQLIFEYNC